MKARAAALLPALGMAAWQLPGIGEEWFPFPLRAAPVIIHLQGATLAGRVAGVAVISASARER